MPLARTYSVALVGVTGHMVEVEVDIANGLVGMILVGLPDTALREARDRIRAAIVNSRETWPLRKITVGLSSASLSGAVGLPCPVGRGCWAGAGAHKQELAKALPYAFGQHRCPNGRRNPRSGRGYRYAAAGCGAASSRNAAARLNVSPMV